MVAGPSEILVICDGKTDPDWIAMDLFSQAEHDEMAQSILIAPDKAYLDKVEQSIGRLLPGMPRGNIISASLASRGALIEVRNLDEAWVVRGVAQTEYLQVSTNLISAPFHADRV